MPCRSSRNGRPAVRARRHGTPTWPPPLKRGRDRRASAGGYFRLFAEVSKRENRNCRPGRPKGEPGSRVDPTGFCPWLWSPDRRCAPSGVTRGGCRALRQRAGHSAQGRALTRRTAAPHMRHRRPARASGRWPDDMPLVRGRSSDGRASRSQCEGQGFDSPRLHHTPSQRVPVKYQELPENREFFYFILLLVPADSDIFPPQLVENMAGKNSVEPWGI